MKVEIIQEHPQGWYYLKIHDYVFDKNIAKFLGIDIKEYTTKMLKLGAEICATGEITFCSKDLAEKALEELSPWILVAILKGAQK